MSTDVTPAVPDLADHVIGEILATMGRRRISSAGLGRRLNKPNYWVLRRLNRKIPIDLDDLERIANALEVNVFDLLPRERKTTAEYLPGERVIATIGDPNRPHRTRRPVKRRKPFAMNAAHPATPVAV